MSNKITFFPVDNGDTVLFEIDKNVILTDIHYRKSSDDESEEEHYPIGPDIKKICSDKRLFLFVNTHPDKDHVLGFSEIFFVGDPKNWNKQNENILVEEIWVTPFTATLKNESEQAKDFVKEVRRRKKLIGTKEGNMAGNKIKIRSYDDSETSGAIGDSLDWYLLGPTLEECADAKDDEDERNNSSMVISWTFKTKENKFTLLMGGDAEKEAWERIHEDKNVGANNLKWNCLLAPHHCSRSTFADKDENGNYILNKKAFRCISHTKGRGWIVSSSKEVKKNNDKNPPPPNWWARGKYLEILKSASSHKPESRFLNPATHGKDAKPMPVIFTVDDDNYKPGWLIESSTIEESLNSGANSYNQRYGTNE